MTRKLLILVAVLSLTALTSPPPAQAASCTTQIYCNYCGTPTMTTSNCCCPPGTEAAGQVATCRQYNFGVCNDPCWGKGPTCSLGGV
jgi:hypothetical protein